MSTSRIFVTKRKVVYLCHICSSCNNPVLSHVTITSEGQKTFSYMEEHATELANRLADEGIRDEISRIKKSIEEHTEITSESGKRNYRGVGRFCSSHISGHDSPCPNCGAQEVWMGVQSNNPFPIEGLDADTVLTEEQYAEYFSDNTPEESFPVLFTFLPNAEKWATDYTESQINKIRCTNLSTEDLDIARKNHAHLFFSVKDLLSQSEVLLESTEISLLEKEMSEVQDSHSNLHFFDFRKKIALNRKLKEIETELQMLKQNLLLKRTNLISKIDEITSLMREAQINAYGCSGKYITKKLGNATVYLVEPAKVDEAIVRQYISTY